ncbi:MAG: CHC2 zinc finger domain-containing protein [Patescibacteria group bacterium]
MKDHSYFDSINNLCWEQILQKLGLSAKKTPKGWLKKCLFHKESHASLLLCTEESMRFFCLGCHRMGDKFDFVWLIKFGEFGGTLARKGTARWFEKHFGIPSPYRKTRKRKKD